MECTLETKLVLIIKLIFGRLIYLYFNLLNLFKKLEGPPITISKNIYIQDYFSVNNTIKTCAWFL